MRAKTARFIAGVIIGLGVVSVLAADKTLPTSSTVAKPDRNATGITSPAPNSDYPVIVYLERRGQTIAVKAGPKGPIYSAKTAEGKVLFENLSAEQLRAQAPEVHVFIKSAMARSNEKSGPVMDARIRVMMR